MHYEFIQQIFKCPLCSRTGTVLGVGDAVVNKTEKDSTYREFIFC